MYVTMSHRQPVLCNMYATRSCEIESDVLITKMTVEMLYNTKTNKLRDFSPQANYTDRPTDLPLFGEVSANFSG
jgi:hypothetical protein